MSHNLPHRFPMLFLDRLLVVETERALGEKYVTMNEPYFRGHFPQSPVMPGVLVIEALFQLIWAAWGGEVGLRIHSARRFKFRRSVVPGDVLILEVHRLESEGQQQRFRCQARVEDKLAVEGELTVVSRNFGEGREVPEA